MKIAVLGWGSLIWNPKRESVALNLGNNKWFSDGPELPVEFARISTDKSRDKRLTLVLFPGAKKVQVLWALMDTEDLQEAIANLAEVEGPTPKTNIGYIIMHSEEKRSGVISDITDDIRRWATGKYVDAVIWTDLCSNFEEQTGTEFTEDNVISYLNNLTNDSKKKAEEYIRRAPGQIRTGFRSVIERELGWFPA